MRKAALYSVAIAFGGIFIFTSVVGALGGQTPVQDMMQFELFCTLAIVAAIVGKDK